ncbi:MAG: hypothetical protein JWR09_2171 [Mucilaginibacter sp.]|nr:hypothetical protein [Mucilaginibacter sp.]
MIIPGSEESDVEQTIVLSQGFSHHLLHFVTGNEYKNNMKAVKITFINTGKSAIALDDLELRKEQKK